MPVVLVKPRKLGIRKVQTLHDGRSKRPWTSVLMASKHREKLEKPTRSEVSKETLIQCPCPPGPLLGNSSTVGAPPASIWSHLTIMIPLLEFRKVLILDPQQGQQNKQNKTKQGLGI